MIRSRCAVLSSTHSTTERARLGSTDTRDRRRAFSLIEVVAVIVILGLLAIVALPRFVNLSGDAQSARVAAMSGAFQEAVRLVHATWIARGASARVNAVAADEGWTVGVNDAGWPENALTAGGDGVVSASECADLWSSLLNSPPSISTAAGAAAWLASVQGTTTCRYVDNSASGREFSYDTSTGAVVTTTSASTASTASVAGSSAASTSSPPTASSSSGSSGSGTKTACGLVGPEPFVVLALVHLVRSTRRRGP